jgi:hypothetical protein
MEIGQILRLPSTFVREKAIWYCGFELVWYYNRDLKEFLLKNI